MQGALVVTSGLSPVEKKRTKVFLEDPKIREIVQCTAVYILDTTDIYLFSSFNIILDIPYSNFLDENYFELRSRIAPKLDLAFNNVKPKDWYFVLD